MVVVNAFSPSNDAHKNFFTDFYGLQRLTSVPHKPELAGRQKLDRLCRYFKYEDPGPGLRCVIYMERIKKVFKTHLKEMVSDELLDNVIDLCLLQALKDYNANIRHVKGVLRKLPQKQLERVKSDLDYINDHLPVDFFKVKNDPSQLIKSDVKEKPSGRELDLIFYVPMTEIDPFIEDEVEEISFMAPLTGQYNIGKRYDYYKGKMAEFPYEEFKEIVLTGITSSKSDEELLNYFRDVFGCDVFEFLDEIIRHRNGSIDWSRWTEKAPISSRRLEPKPANRYTPALASQVIVQSEEEKNLAKTLRKIERKQKGSTLQEFV